MINIKNISFIFSMAFALQLNAQQVDSLSLEDFLSKVLANGIEKETAMQDWYQAERDLKIHRADLRPTLNANATIPNFSKSVQEIVQNNGALTFESISYNNSSLGLSARQNIAATGGTLFFDSNLQRFDDFIANTNSYNGAPVEFGIYQPILGFNRWKWDKKIIPLKYAVAEKKLKSDKALIKWRSCQLFVDLLRAHANLQLSEVNVAANARLLEIAQEKIELGKISEGDLKKLELNYIASQREAKAANRWLQQLSANAYNSLGEIYNGENIVPQLPKNLDALPIAEEQALQAARNNRFEYLQKMQRELEAAQELEQAKRENGFQAAVQASLGLARSSKNLEDIYADPKPTQFVNLSVNVPIVDWGRKKAEQALAKHNQRWVQKNNRQLSLELENQLLQMVKNHHILLEELQLAQQIRQLAIDRFEISRQSFVLGAINITELNLAQVEKDNSIRTYIENIASFWTNYYALEAATLYNFIENKNL